MSEFEDFFDPDAADDSDCKPRKRLRPNTRDTGAKDALLPRLEAARLKLGLSDTAFGYIHFKDPAFMKKLRAGRRLYKLRETAKRVCKEAGV